jgi:predicted ester cyclase
VSRVAQNAETSRRLIEEAFTEGNLDLIDEIAADGFVDHDPLMGEQDKQSVKQSISGYRGAFPDLHCDIEDIIEAGDKVIYRWSANGTFENSFMGLEATHEKGDPVKGMTIDRFDADGKVVESWSAWDTLGFMRAIGAVPEQAAAPAGG